MDFALIIYLIDNIAVSEAGYGSSLWWGVVLLIVFLGLFSFWTDGFDNTEKATASEKRGYEIFKSLRPWVLTMSVLLISFGALTRLIPTQETAYKMLAAYGAQTIVQNEDVQKYAKGSLKVLDKAMEDYLGKGWEESK